MDTHKVGTSTDERVQVVERWDERPFCWGLLAFLEEKATRHDPPDRIAVRVPNRVVFVKLQDVDAIEATGNYMHLYRGRESFMVRETLASLAGRLDPHRFLRVHRSWIVNLDRVRSLRFLDGHTYELELADGRQIPVGRRYREAGLILMRQFAPGGQDR